MRLLTLLLVLVACTSGCATNAASGVQPRMRAHACAAPTRDTTSLAMSRRYAGQPAPLFDRAAAVYVQEGFEVAVADRSEGLLVSRPRFTWPTQVGAEWQARDHPGVQVVTMLRAAGPDSTDVMFVGHVFCQVRTPGASAPSDTLALAVKGLMVGLLAVAFDKAGAPKTGEP